LQAWDNLPRFTFLEADLSKIKKQEATPTRKRMPVKPIFVGSPVRYPEEGGLLSTRAQRLKKKSDE